MTFDGLSVAQLPVPTRNRRATTTTTRSAAPRTKRPGNPTSSAKPVDGRAVAVGDGVVAPLAFNVCWADCVPRFVNGVDVVVAGVAVGRTTTWVRVTVAVGGTGVFVDGRVAVARAAATV